MFRGHLKGFLILTLITGIIVTSATITQATPAALRSSRFHPSSKFSKAVILRMPVVRLMDQTLMQMGKRVRTCSWRVIKTARQAISALVTSTTILPSQTMKMWGAISTCTCKTAARLSVPFMFHPVASLTTNNVSTEQRR